MRKVGLISILLTAAPAMAMNGLRPIGASAESNALGGTGVSNFYNYYDALYKNPAELAQATHAVGQSQAVFGMTYGNFMPAVKATYGDDQEYKKPVNNTAGVFPSSMGLGRRLSERMAMAVGVYGGGGGADYGDKADVIYRAKSKTTAFALTSGLGWAFTSGSTLGVSGTVSRVDTRASNLNPRKKVMAETSGTAITPGVMVGASHRVGHFSAGAILQPAQTAFLSQARDIEDNGTKNDLYFTPIPNEAAVGVAWRQDYWMATADYRFLQWSQAEFLKSVGWLDQHVLAVGYEYGLRHRLRLGFNISTDAVADRSGADGYDSVPVSGKKLLNLAGDAFATTSGLGVTNHHLTIGSGHAIGQSLNVNTAFVYMEPGSLERTGYYDVPTGRKQYGWKSQFGGTTLQVDLAYLW